MPTISQPTARASAASHVGSNGRQPADRGPIRQREGGCERQHDDDCRSAAESGPSEFRDALGRAKSGFLQGKPTRVAPELLDEFGYRLVVVRVLELVRHTGDPSVVQPLS